MAAATAPPGDGDYAITLAPYACAAEEKTISLAKDVIVVVRKVLDSGWVYVVVLQEPQRAGYFPVSYLKKITKEEALAATAPPPVTTAAPPLPSLPPAATDSPKPIPSPVDAAKSPVAAASPRADVPPPMVPRKESAARPPLSPVVSQSSGTFSRPAPVHVASTLGGTPAALPPVPGSPSVSHPSQLNKATPIQSRTNAAPSPAAAAGGAPSSKDISHLALGEAVANVNSRFQDYVMYQSRLINKFRTSLEAQTTLMDANNDLAICIHEFGKKLAGDDCQTVGEGNLGACMMKISEVLLNLERLKCQQRTLEQEVVQHFLDFVNVSAPNIRKQKNSFDAAQQEYLDASLRLREMGMKAKVKLENVKQAETEKAEKKTVYHSTTASLLENLKILLHEENATLLSHFSNWMDTLNETTQSTQRNLNRDMTFVRMWKDAAATESQLKFEEKGKAALLLQNFEGETSSLKEQLIMLSSKSNMPMKSVGGDPVQKLLDSLVRDERKYVHRIAAIQNIYLAELKKEGGLLPPEDEKKIFLNIAEIVDFHTKFLKSLEKAFNCWPFPHLAGLFLDMFKPDIFASYGEYIGKLGNSRSVLKKLRQKKDQWRNICKTIQQRHDIDALGDLIMLPQNRLEKYIKFLSDYLELIPETEPDYIPATDTLLHFEECFDDIIATPSRTELIKVAGVDLNNEEDIKETHRQFIHKGNAEVKSRDANISANFLYLCSDQLVICHKRVDADSKSKTPQFVASLYLSDMIIKQMPENHKIGLATSDSEYTCTFADSKEKKIWINYLTRTIEERERRYKLFGVPLKVVMRREKDRSIPKFMVSALDILLRHKESEGIFRLSGTQRIIKQAIHDLNQGKQNVFSQMDEHSLAGVLKQFFRDLPEPLLTWDLYDTFVESVRSVSEVGERVPLISAAIEKLPRGNRFDIRERFIKNNRSFSSVFA
jgi:hypothetical protein